MVLAAATALAVVAAGAAGDGYAVGTTLSALTLSGIDIGTFDPATKEYAADVDHGVRTTTVAATPNDPEASVVIEDADGSTLGSSRTTQLAEGANLIRATVTSAEGQSTTYRVTVTRALPNVVVILADDLGWGDVRANNPASGIPTPHIDGLAASGIRFTDAHSAGSICSPSRYALLTGRFRWRTGRTSGNALAEPTIETSRRTLGTLLQDAGYRTAAIGKWHVGMQQSYLDISRGPLDHGFHEFFGMTDKPKPQFYYVRDNRMLTETFAHEQAHDRFVGEAVAFIERAAQAQSPFLLYFAPKVPHTPIVPQESALGRTELGDYGDFVAQLDDGVGRLLAALEAAGADDDTLVIFTSDNGSYMVRRDETQADHVDDSEIRGYRATRHQANGPFRGGKSDIWEGGHRVPFVVRWPGAVSPASESIGTIVHTDVFATLAEIVGATPGSDEAEDSVSFLSALRGEAAARGSPIVHNSGSGTPAIRDGRWKLVFGSGSGGREKPLGSPFERPWPLFDLLLDPGETHDAAPENPAVVARLKGLFEGSGFPLPDFEPDDASLASLGLAGVDLDFSSAQDTYTATAGADVDSTVVTAHPVAFSATVVIADADGSTAGTTREVALAHGANTITVTVTAADGQATQTYRVTVTRAPAPSAVVSNDATLAALTLTGIDIGTFDPATTEYAADVGSDVETTTVTATPNDLEATVVIADAHGSTTGTARTVALGYGSNRVTATVTAADGESTATYAATVTRARPPLTAQVEQVPDRHDGSSKLEFALRFNEQFGLSYQTLRAGFEVAGGTLLYTRRKAPPGNLLWRIGVRPAGDGEVVATLPGNRPCAEKGAVCAADGRMLSNSPTATIPGPLPLVSIAADASPVTEGEAAMFTLTRTGDAAPPLTVPVSVSASGEMLAENPPAQVTFAAGANTAALAVNTVDDRVVEAAGTVTATVAAGGGYAVALQGAAAAVVVADDDAPAWSVAAAHDEIEEGGSTTVTVSVTNGVTFAADQALALAASGTAAADDYRLGAASLTLAAGDGSVATTLKAADDDAQEPDETVTVTVAHAGETVGTATVTIAANDAPLSNDATLSVLTLSGIDFGAFDPATTDYAADVGNDVETTTVTATPNDATATVVIADPNGSTAGRTRTVSLAAGANAIAVTVTAADGETAKAYAVTVTRAAASAAWGTRLPDRDIDLSAASRPRGLASDGETLWAGDWDAAKVVAYALSDGARSASRDFGLGSFLVAAVYTDGETLWAADYGGGVYAYRLSDGARLADDDLDREAMAAAGNDRPTGLWSDGETLWVADHSDGHAYAYAIDGGARQSGKEFSLRPDSDTAYVEPFGLWSDGETVLATDWLAGTVRGYALAGGARRSGNDIAGEATANAFAAGLWSDGETLWVVDEFERKAYAYAAPGLRERQGRRQGLLPDLASRATVVPWGAAAGPPVSIPDPGLRGRIALALGKGPTERIGESELAALVVLDARGAGVADLSGLQHAVNLQGLDLGHGAVADLRPLALLPALRHLNLDGALSDPWQLAPLGGLTGLSLRDNGLEEVRALSTMAALEALDLSGNRINDLTAVAALKRLRILDIGGNPVADLSPLSGLEGLTEVRGQGNRTYGLQGAP